MIHFKNRSLTVFQSALYKTTSAVVETKDFVLVSDPNWLPNEIDEIKKYVDKIRKGRQLYLLFTHSDFDHIIGYKAFPEAKVIASRALIENPEQEQILEQIREFDNKYYLERDYEIVYPVADIVIAKDDQTLTIGETTLTFYTAPGHTADGIFTILKPEGIWIAGDYLSDIEFPFMYDSSIAYEETMRKAEEILHDHAIKILVPGHGDVADSYEEIKTRQEDSLNYIQKLKAAVKNDECGGIEKFVENVHFPNGMKKAHEDNMELMKKELKPIQIQEIPKPKAKNNE